MSSVEKLKKRVEELREKCREMQCDVNCDLKEYFKLCKNFKVAMTELEKETKGM